MVFDFTSTVIELWRFQLLITNMINNVQPWDIALGAD